MFEYPYGYPGLEEDLFAGAEFGLGGALGAILTIYLVMMLLILAFSVVCYIFQSLGLYTIAKRRGIRHGWLAWIPLGNLWILGSVSDQYQYVAKGKVKNRRKILLGLYIAFFAIYVFFIFAMVLSLILSEGLGSGAVAVAVLSLFGMLAFLAVAILLSVFQYISLYDLFRSTQPEDATLFLVLSIFFSVALPFLVFACRKKDLGMPPKRQPQPVQQIAEPVAEAPEEPAATEEGYAEPEEFEE